MADDRTKHLATTPDSARITAAAAFVCALLAAAGCELTGSMSENMENGEPTKAETAYDSFLGGGRARRHKNPVMPDAGVERGAFVSSGFPIVECSVTPEKTTTHVIWPFFTAERTKSSRTYILRPIFKSVSTPDTRDVSVLWPFFRYRRKKDYVHAYFFPLWNYTRRTRRVSGRKEVDTDWMFTPLLLGGSDTREGRYFAFFPVGGKVKGLLGKKEISFVLWPLWQRTVEKNYIAHHVVYPLFGWWKGKEHHGWRIFPFAGVNVRKGKYRSRFWMWPLFTHIERGLDTKCPSETFFFFPFYGRVRSPNTDNVTVLWPLFGRVRKRDRHLEEWHVFWPFFSWSRGDGIRTVKMWPLFSSRRSNAIRQFSALWPFYRSSTTREGRHVRRWRNIGLLYYANTEEWVEKELDGRKIPFEPPRRPYEKRIPDPRIRPETEREHAARLKLEAAPGIPRRRDFVRFWPLFHFRRSEHNEVQFQALSVWPFKDPKGEFAQMWGPFFTIYSYERDASGGKRSSALLGLYRHVNRPELRHWNFMGIFRYTRRGTEGEYKRFSFLGGLIGYERRGRSKGFRFLWIPFKRARADAAGEVATRKELK